MIDKTPLEQQALAAALRPLGEAATEIGMDKPLSAYTREEVLILIETIVDAYQKHLLDRRACGQFPPHLKEGVS
jgi:hypothetical protein